MSGVQFSSATPRRKETMTRNLRERRKKYDYTILRPGGNDQMLIKGIVPTSQKRRINDEMIKRYPNVEQVSFYEYDIKNKKATLELAGGEFCGNATRSLAYLLLRGKKGQIDIKVSGIKKKLKAGITQKNTAFAQMPIKSFKVIKKLRNNLFRVDLEGITQLICIQKKLDNKNLKQKAFEILEKENLIYSVPAAGVMFITKKSGLINMEPVVWVRDIETLLYETACASGTAAVGIWKAAQNKAITTKVKILQPSGKIIKALIYKKEKDSVNVYINGEIEILNKGNEQL